MTECMWVSRHSVSHGCGMLLVCSIYQNRIISCSLFIIAKSNKIVNKIFLFLFDLICFSSVLSSEICCYQNLRLSSACLQLINIFSKIMDWKAGDHGHFVEARVECYTHWSEKKILCSTPRHFSYAQNQSTNRNCIRILFRWVAIQNPRLPS